LAHLNILKFLAQVKPFYHLQMAAVSASLR